MTQSFNIPDGFSPDMLQAMLKEAIPEEVAHAVELSTDYDHDDDCESEDCEEYSDTSMTKSQIYELAHALAEEGTDKCPNPIIHKVMLYVLIENMIHWHSVAGANFISKDNDIVQATAWLRDAGKFQAIANILDTINVGPDDFTCCVK